MSEVMSFLATTLARMGSEFTDLRPDMRLEEDLGVESLMRLELATKLEKRFGRPIGDAIDRFETVGEIAAYLEDGGLELSA
jgi:acyl carrier protein